MGSKPIGSNVLMPTTSFPHQLSIFKDGGGGGQITISQNNVSPQYSAILTPEGGGVLLYMAYTGMCRWKGYGFRPLCPKQGI